VSGLLDTLERGELIERRPHPQDLRAHRVLLSRRGRALLQRILPSHFKRHGAVMGGLSKSERDELVRLLLRIEPRKVGDHP
jgi:DNA-binding MarR family transcriptional regulator